LLNAKADANIADEEGMPALVRATMDRNPACVQLLVDANGNVEHKLADGRTPLMIASKQGFNDIVDILLKAKARKT